jgi:signal transduction histidine kinase
MNNGSGTARERLSQIIEQQRDEIEQRWLERVRRDVVGHPGVELTQLRDGMPDYLVELAKALSESPDQGGESAWSKVARDHGITRVRIGFDISQLVHEFVVLRRVLYDVVQQHDPEFSPDTDLTELVDSAIGVAVQSYVDARDYEMRRAQAANIGFLIHELRQPVSTALLTSAWLRTHAVSEQLPTLDTLERTLRRLGELIDSVLLTEKLEAGEVQPQPRETKLAQLMEPVERLKEAAERKGLRFQATYDPELTVVVDPILTRSVINNLLENAVKYTDHGVVEVSVTQTRDEIVLNVCDTCQGLSPEELLTIFEPFKRGRTDKTGTGLGLAIVRRAVEAQGGCIHAESPGPSGCRFTVRLPCRIQHDRPQRSSALTVQHVENHA